MKKRLKIKNILILIIILCIIPLMVKSFNREERHTNEEAAKKFISSLTMIGNDFDKYIPKERRMSLFAVGDALIHNGVYLDAYIGNGNYDFTKMFTYVKEMAKDYDLKYYNQETIIGGKKLGVSHYPRFNSPDEIALALVNAGFNLVSLANNHSYDKGEKAILYSVDFWRKKDVVTSGQARSFDDREDNIKVYEKNGIRYAFLAYTNSINGFKLPKGKEYLINLYSDEQAKKDIEKIKDKADVIIVSMHWGNEYTFKPNDLQKKQAKYLSDLGVDLIIGSHPHVIQPVGYVGNTLVIYSLGNLISAQHSLGIDKIVGLSVGMDIVVTGDRVTFENVKYELLYTYCTSNYKNFKVIPFSKLDNKTLSNYKKLEKKYLDIVNSEVKYD